MTIPSIIDEKVAQIFHNYSAIEREKLLEIRTLIFQTAASTPRVGTLEETVKWGQVSYLTAQTKSGSIIRIDKIKNNDHKVGIFFHCQTDLVKNFRKQYPTVFEFEGNRCLIVQLSQPLPKKELSDCIKQALTYKIR